MVAIFYTELLSEFCLSTRWLLTRLKLLWVLFLLWELPLSVPKNRSWLFWKVSLLVAYIIEPITNSLFVYSFPLSLLNYSQNYNYRSSLSLVAENDDCDLKQRDGCLTKDVSVKKGKRFSYFIVGLLAGSFCKLHTIKSLKDCDTVKPSGNEKFPDFIFL